MLGSRGAALSWSCLAVVLLPLACFDSDETFKSADTTGTTGEPSTTTFSFTTAVPTSSSEGPGQSSCRDAIDCIFACAIEINSDQPDDIPANPLACFLKCDTGLTVDDALVLLRLGECVTDSCIAADQCDVLVDTSTGGDSSTGDSSSSSSESSSSSSSSSTGGSSDSGSSSSDSSSSSSSSSSDEGGTTSTISPQEQCTICIAARLNDPAPPGCEEIAAMCE